jgi:hypothetical protein
MKNIRNLDSPQSFSFHLCVIRSILLVYARLFLAILITGNILLNFSPARVLVLKAIRPKCQTYPVAS